MSSQPELAPVARLDFVATGAGEPGWYIRYVVDGRPINERLAIAVGADAFGAIEEAAEKLGCAVEQIEFGGPVWPMPLDGMVDANETLEFVADVLPAIGENAAHDGGEWRLLQPVGPRERVDQRRYTRRKVEGVLLYGPIYGRVLNWSEAGMGIEISRPLRLEARDLFVAKGKRSRIEHFGEVRWCHRIDDQTDLLDEMPTYHAGITLLG